jgi:hypothetical protein
MHYHCDAINVLIRGRKRWFLQPPAHATYSKMHPLLWMRDILSLGEESSEVAMDGGEGGGGAKNSNASQFRDLLVQLVTSPRELNSFSSEEARVLRDGLLRKKRGDSTYEEDTKIAVCDQNEGDLIYVPAMHGHSTVNLERSVGFAFESCIRTH